MIQDLISLFKSAYDEHGDKIIIDNYTLKDGLYIRINEDNTKDYLAIKYTKNKDGTIGYIPGAYQNEHTAKLYNWFVERDYYSSVKDMNKPIDPKKKIHSNNYLTIFIKKDNLIGEKKLSRNELIERIDQYFEILKNPEIKHSDPRSKLLLESVEPAVDEEEVIAKHNFFRTNISNIINEVENRKEEFDNYVKVFLATKDDLRKYEMEYRRYMIPNVFNKNDYNVDFNEMIFGLSNNNMGMNAKKTYLELKTTKFKVPFRISSDDAMILTKFFDWLYYQNQGALYIPVDYNFKISVSGRKNLISNDCHYLYITKGKDVTIEDYEFLPRYSNKIEFELKNYLQMEEGQKDNKYIIEDKFIDQTWKLESEVDEVFFNKRLKISYFSEPSIKGDFSKKMVNLLMICRDAFYNYFNKGNSLAVVSVIDKISLDIVKELLSNGSFYRAAKGQNLRLSFLEYFGLEGKLVGGKIKGLLDEIQNKINQDNIVDLNNDDEFYFLAGQLAYFILSKSSASKKTHDMVEGFTKAKSHEELKKQLLYFYDRYKHAISFNDDRFNKALSMLQGYDAEDNRKKEDIFISGLLSKNIFYMKKKGE